ncbi:unnamed protein product [Acanthoscelides obtectus]|uniref:Uncharacterized protein n=1 Tax=Acanthoscelides obtectus TaxID=200917 RepID=A0A9P0JTG7_ACAOB|nr:unnamed protein product [Acanthoscelides obtectus]CAK1668023.1 hypothetical protein AOBTE_LOCUS26182 [Acanthoscelides obtectus]
MPLCGSPDLSRSSNGDYIYNSAAVRWKKSTEYGRVAERSGV